MGKLLVHVGDGDRRVVEANSIYYVEAVNGDTMVRRRARSLRDVRELGVLERAWKRHGFVRLHKDYLVHPDRILRIRKRESTREWEVRLAPPVNRVLPVRQEQHTRAFDILTTADGNAELFPSRHSSKTQNRAHFMRIQVGYELVYELPQPTPMILALNIHYSRASSIVVPDHMRTQPEVPITSFRDGFGNWCNRLVAPQGTITITSNAIVNDTGMLDAVVPSAQEHAIERLPEETLVFLLGSRYCETDRLSELAWKMFSGGAPGWARVQRICDFVHEHVQFGYEYADSTKTAWDTFQQRRGVCRDFAHLAVTFCRCMNIPARYCTGYLGDIGVPPPHAPMDFAAWFEVYLGGSWHTFDPRNNTPRIGRVLIARGRDAADVPLTTTFGPNKLVSFRVWTDELPAS